MAIIDVQDIRDALPGHQISATSVPTETQVAEFIADTESDLRAELAGHFVAWPDPASADAHQQEAARFLRRTIIEGAVWLTLRAKYARSKEDAIPMELENADEAFHDRLKRLKTVVAGIRRVTPDSIGGVGLPKLGAASFSPHASGSFAEWTAAVDYQTGRRRKLFR